MSSASSSGDTSMGRAVSIKRRPRATTRQAQADAPSQDEVQPIIAAFLRALADCVEQDPAFGRALLAIYAQSCSTGPGADDVSAPRKARTRRAASRPQGTQVPSAATAQSAATSAPSPTPDPPTDPFALLRAHGEAALRARLGELEPASLRSMIRAYRLDPARISARWSARERLVDLIVEQVRARTSLGRAFERV